MKVSHQLFYGIYYQIKHLEDALCAPLQIPAYRNDLNRQKIIKLKQGCFPKEYLDKKYELSELLNNKNWLKHAIIRKTPRKIKLFNEKRETSLGFAFSEKYGCDLFKDDARDLVKDWSSEVERAISHLNSKTLSGNILHIGADVAYEPSVLHKKANTITLADISEKLLSLAVKEIKPTKSILSRAEKLSEIDSNSIDLYIALRVFNSFRFRSTEAIKEAKRILRSGGSIFLSVSNGYKAIDETILPGQIIGKTSRLSLSEPFQQVLKIIALLHTAGFHELFVVPGSAEIFIGGTLISADNSIIENPIIHTEGVNNIPLCFYSEKMPTSWLGNFSNHQIRLNGILWPSVEHFFQSEKYLNINHRNEILKIKSAFEAKKYAWDHQNEVRDDWNNVRVQVMKTGLIAKFSQYSYLKSALLNTGQRVLIERSSHDLFWGENLQGSGENMLGNLLMDFRTKAYL